MLSWWVPIADLYETFQRLGKTDLGGLGLHNGSRWRRLQPSPSQVVEEAGRDNEAAAGACPLLLAFNGASSCGPTKSELDRIHSPRAMRFGHAMYIISMLCQSGALEHYVD